MTDANIAKANSASGERVFVIGDLHGVVEEPTILLEHLDKEEGLTNKDLVVFLGDYIDRGKNSRGVVELMIDFKSRFKNTRFLKGNHEDMLLDFIGYGGRLGHAFLYNGGLETLQSYGISVFSPPDEMVESMPEEHVDFFKNLETIIEVDQFMCVHAGLNPKKSMDEQNDDDALWIRDEFISSEHSFKKVVVFGHTPHQEVFMHLPYKIGLDTGLVFGNKLSCLELKSGKLLQILRGSKEVVEDSVEINIEDK